MSLSLRMLYWWLVSAGKNIIWRHKIWNEFHPRESECCWCFQKMLLVFLVSLITYHALCVLFCCKVNPLLLWRMLLFSLYCFHNKKKAFKQKWFAYVCLVVCDLNNRSCPRFLINAYSNLALFILNWWMGYLTCIIHHVASG